MHNPDPYLESDDLEEVRRVQVIFERFDTNGDGLISYDELGAVLKGVDPEHWNDTNVTHLLKAIDTDHDGSIMYEELLHWIMGTDEIWAEARQSVLLRAKKRFCPGDIVSINRQVERDVEPFEMEVEMSPTGPKLGCALDAADGKTLFIKTVRQGGLLDQWNNENPDLQVGTGARILEITATVYTNRFEKGARGKSHVEVYKAKDDPHAMVDLLKKEAVLKLLILPCKYASTYSLKLADSYELLSTIHEGTCAAVKKMKQRRTGAVCAVKSVLKSKVAKDSFLSEFELMKKLDHPNVLNLQEVFEDFHCIHLVLQLCEGGELLEQVLENEKFSERQAARSMQQVLAAVMYLHSQSICHRDVKCDNLLLELSADLDRANIKLVDFGAARKFEMGRKLRTVTGAAEYQSMEMIGFRGYTHLTDVWSCGVVMYVLVGGYPPFMGESDGATRKLIRQGIVDFGGTEWQVVSDDAKDLIVTLLSPEAKRPSADDAFRHQWVKDLAPKAVEMKLDHAYENIRAFSSQGRVKKLARYALAKCLSCEDLGTLRKEFELIDKNKDGSVTFHEFRQMVDKHNDKDPEQIRRAFEAMDVNGNRRIEYTEFLAAAMDQQLHTQEQACWMAFNVFDRDGSGQISKKELKGILELEDTKEMLANTFGSTSSTLLERCIAECDRDHDGQIDFEEFLEMMQSTEAQPSGLVLNRTKTLRI